MKRGITNFSFVEFYNDFTDDNGVTFIDAYKPDGDGQTIAYIVEGRVYPCNPDYRLDRVITESISEMGYIW
jgi:hypothetical protein